MLIREPRGTGIVIFSPAAFVVVKVVSSALVFGTLTTGGNHRSASFITLGSSRSAWQMRMGKMTYASE